MGYNFIGDEHEKGHDETHSLTTPDVRKALDEHGWLFHDSDPGESDGAFAERTYYHPNHLGHHLIFRRYLGGGEGWEHLRDETVLGEGALEELPKYLNELQGMD